MDLLYGISYSSFAGVVVSISDVDFVSRRES